MRAAWNADRIEFHDHERKPPQNPAGGEHRGNVIRQQRCARRIELGRVWICEEKETLTFKADIMSETPDVIYLEGIYVDPSHRGNGYGLGCLAQVSENLLRSARSLCLFVNEQHTEAQEFYSRAGFTLRSRYSTIFLEPRRSSAIIDT